MKKIEQYVMLDLGILDQRGLNWINERKKSFRVGVHLFNVLKRKFQSTALPSNAN